MKKQVCALAAVALLLGACAQARRPAPTLSDPPSVSQAELNQYLRKERK